MNTIDLKGKKVLFIAPKFFGYEIQIVQAMQKLGATVFFHSDKPSENRWAKVMLRIFPKLVWSVADRIYVGWLDKQQLNRCDVVFVVKGEAISPNYLRILHQRYPAAKFVFYMWDSIANVKHTLNKLVFFDSISSFDSHDCQAYPQIRYRPLFFIEQYQQKSIYPAKPGLFFFGTLNGDRPRVLARVIRALNGKLTFDYSLFVRSKWELILRKLVDSSFSIIDKDCLLFVAISASEIKQRMSACNCVLDIEHPKQTGLTMRTFEVLASGKKLITTNQSIRNEQFFDPTNICVIDRFNPIIPENFLRFPAQPLAASFYLNNSLYGWLVEVLGIEKVKLNDY